MNTELFDECLEKLDADNLLEYKMVMLAASRESVEDKYLKLAKIINKNIKDETRPRIKTKLKQYRDLLNDHVSNFKKYQKAIEIIYSNAPSDVHTWLLQLEQYESKDLNIFLKLFLI